MITAEPFLRWAGGKRWLARHLAPILHGILAESEGTYIEPFLGAGAMFFGLAPQRSVLSDLNRELIDSYIAVRDSWQDVENAMKEWNVDRETYYSVRSCQPKSIIDKAARFIWLNRACYGGLYRVNKNNQFNVPYGGGTRTPETLYKNQTLSKASYVLKSGISSQVLISVSDFKDIVDSAASGDVVYCDPTYSNVTREHFDRYGNTIFGWNDQIRLGQVTAEAFSRGATVIISNGFFEDLIPLFPSAYRIHVAKNKTIGNCAGDPKKHSEYLFILDPHRRKILWEQLALILDCTLLNNRK